MAQAETAVTGGSMCAWAGCAASFEGNAPEGWRWLLLYGRERPAPHVGDIPGKTWDRDTVLCPEHAAALNALLKDSNRGQRLASGRP